MSSGWKQEYAKLADYVSEHPEIKIAKGMIRIPSNVREQFYSLFNSTRMAVVRECVFELLDESRYLIRNYNASKEKASKLLNLQSISSQPTVQRFLDDADDWLARELLDPLFNLLSGAITDLQFEDSYAGLVRSSVPSMYEKAYGRWLAVSLINWLEPDELMTVPLPKLHPRDRAAVGGKDVFDSIRPPQKSDRIDFQFELFQLFTTPDYIVHSSLLDKYVGIRTQYEDSLGAAEILPPSREWFPVSGMGDVTSGMMLVYMAENPFDIAAVADRLKICRPDMIIECRTQKDWVIKEGFENIKRHHNNLKPVCGTFLMSKVRMTDAHTQDLGEGIKVLTADVNDNSLAPIVNALKTLASIEKQQIPVK